MQLSLHTISAQDRLDAIVEDLATSPAGSLYFFDRSNQQYLSTIRHHTVAEKMQTEANEALEQAFDGHIDALRVAFPRYDECVISFYFLYVCSLAPPLASSCGR